MVYFDYMEEQRAKNKHKKIIKYILAVVSCITVLCGSFFITYHFLTLDNNKIKTVKESQIVKNNESNVDNTKNPDTSSMNTNTTDNTNNGSENTSVVNTNSTVQPVNTENNVPLVTPKPSPTPKATTLSGGRLPKSDSTTQDKVTDIYYTEEKVCYLTFDDGPSSSVTPKILDILKQYNVPATFFVLGTSVENNPDLLKREYNEGHYIANHSYSHSYSSLYSDPENVIAEYEQTEALIKNALGIQEYNTCFFRFPGGSSGGPYDGEKSIAKQMLEERNIVYTNWNCLTGDAAGNNTAEEQIQGFLETKGDQAGLIVLMHDAADKDETVKALPEIIKLLKEDGYVFKNFYDIFQ